MLYAMEPVDADWYTQVGFWLSVVGILVSSIGLGATYCQVRKARKSADAARDAAELTRTESKASFNRYLAATVHRHLSEVEGFVVAENWLSTVLRCDDMAGLLTLLSEQIMTDEYMSFSVLFRETLTKARKQLVMIKWYDLTTRTKRRIHSLTAPFDIEEGPK